MNRHRKGDVIVVPFSWLLSHFVAGSLVTLFVITWFDSPSSPISGPLSGHALVDGALVGVFALVLDFAISRPIVAKRFTKATALQRDAIQFIGLASLIAGQIVSSFACL